jgi:hypothetical protein
MICLLSSLRASGYPERRVRDNAPYLNAFVLSMLLTFAVMVPAMGAAESKVIVPRETIVLTDGTNLSAFYTWLAKFGRDQDPDRVFTLVEQIDGAPAIRISGQWYGGIVTKERYANYRLVVEYRWGLSTWGDRKDKARDSGVLLHLQGEDGNNNKNFRGAWTRSVEFQILEGGTGDIWLVPGYDRDNPTPIQPQLTMTTRKHPLGFPQWDPNGTPTELHHFGRIGWGGLDPDWKPELGFRGRHDVEKPLGQWNRIEAICDGGNLTYFVNGTKVSEGRNGTFKEGRLLFQSEGAEIFYRRIELHPLNQ